MKKFLVFMLVLLILAAVVFGFGYLPLRAQVGSVSILFSKTSGWDPQPVEPGVFAWRWELLIPTNAQIIRFPDQQRSILLQRSDVLPSADLYALFLEGQPSLDQRIALRVTYRPHPKWIASLAPRGIEPEALGEQLQFMDHEIKTATGVFLDSAIQNVQDTTSLHREAVSSHISESLRQRFDDVDIIAVVVEELTLPDVALWQLGRDAYTEVQQARQAALAATAGPTAQEELARERLIATLERYGTVFQEFPVILDYLQIVATTGRDPLNLNAENPPSLVVPSPTP